jgi:hypothetical protein
MCAVQNYSPTLIEAEQEFFESDDRFDDCPRQTLFQTPPRPPLVHTQSLDAQLLLPKSGMFVIYV